MAGGVIEIGRSEGAGSPAGTGSCDVRTKIILDRAIARRGPFAAAAKPGYRVASYQGGTLMLTTPSSTTTELDRLGDQIAALSAHLDAATARLLILIREFDARGGWSNGFRSCAHWLAWRVGLDLHAARERVRVARALGTLPLLA